MGFKRSKWPLIGRRIHLLAVDGDGFEKEIVAEGQGQATQLRRLPERRHQQRLRDGPRGYFVSKLIPDGLGLRYR